MSILGVGTDLVAKFRIRALLGRYQERFVNRVLSAEEQIEYNKQPSVDFLAKRFAGKEATAKALGTGIGKKIAFREISILNHLSGQPQVTLMGKATELIKEFNIQAIHISLSDEKDYALAFVIIQRN